MLKAGIDIGFGDVKAVFSDNRKIKFPTAIVRDPGGAFNVSTGKEEGFHNYNGSNYYVGKTALHMGQTYSTRSMEFMENFTPLLVHVALEKAGFINSEVKHLSIGLQLGKSNAVGKAFLLKKIEEGVVDGKKLGFEHVEVIPQGVGILLDSRFNWQGQELVGAGINTLVVDIGFNTVDVLVAIDGQPKKGRSEMLERSGISWICERLIARVKERTGSGLTEQQAKNALLNGYVEMYGKKIDLGLDIKEISNGYAEWLHSELRSRWEEQMAQFPRIILAGGGAHIVKPYMPHYMQNIITPAEPEFANARGFFKWLQVQKKAA